MLVHLVEFQTMQIFHPARVDGGLDGGPATLVTQFALTFDFNDTAYRTEPPNVPLAYAKITGLPGRSAVHQTNRLCPFAKISLTALIALAGRAVYGQDPPGSPP